MTDDFSTELRTELLDDFYAECDEQLSLVREQLLLLEASFAASASNPAALESLYRGVHSFKGNAAIVGLGSAETLAHAVEGLLGSLTRGESDVSAATLDLVARAAHSLEQIVTAFRLKHPAPDITALLDGLEPYDGASPSPLGSPSRPVTVPTAQKALLPGETSWRVLFSPSAELDARGINVTAVRARLAQAGEVVSSAPRIQPGGVMQFDFTLIRLGPPTEIETWAADGITWEQINAVAEPVLVDEDRAADIAGGSMFIAPSHVVRVDLGRLDELMRITGELVVHRLQLEERIARFASGDAGLQEVNHGLARLLAELRSAITRVRLVPIGEVFTRLPFVTRDLTRETGKRVRLVIEGEDTEVDKFLVERLKEPLLHLVRNAVSHGIELPDVRAARGKPPEAVVLLRASAVGDTVVIQIRDDGRGVDLTRVAERAHALGLPVPEPLDHAALLNLLCASGFSTRDHADRTAGRGLGMAVVAETVRDLSGTLTLETEPGAWTQFTIRLPVTLSITNTFVVSVGAVTYVVPRSFIGEVMQVFTRDIRRLEDVDFIAYRDGVLPLVRLRTLFGADSDEGAQVAILVVSSDEGLSGLVVDRIKGQREVVVRPMRDPLIHVRGISGATELGDGEPVLILDPIALTQARARSHRILSSATPWSRDPVPQRQTA